VRCGGLLSLFNNNASSMSSIESAVQMELQDYLSEKGVNSLFIKIVEQLLLSKPESPVSFMMEYLKVNFPEDTKGFCRIEDLQEKKDPAEIDDSDEDSDEFIGTIPQMKSNSSSRRLSVSAAVLHPNTLAPQKRFEKSPVDNQRLTDILKRNFLCAHLDESDLKTLVDAFETTETEAGVEILRQGDLVAEHYYVLDTGSAEVFKDGEKILTYSSGDGFGELALMYNTPRAATVKSCSECKLWRLDQTSFKAILVASAINKREKYIEFLELVPILGEMALKELQVLADTLVEHIYVQDDVIVNEGDPGDEFFIIASGSVSVFKKGEEVSVLKEGNYFGEIALISTKNRQATVVAKTSTVKVLVVHRKVFQRVLGPITDMLWRNSLA